MSLLYQGSVQDGLVLGGLSFLTFYNRDHNCALSRVSLFCDTMDCSWPGSSVHGILQASIWSELPSLSPGDFLAWRIPWTEKPGGLQSVGLQNRT